MILVCHSTGDGFAPADVAAQLAGVAAATGDATLIVNLDAAASGVAGALRRRSVRDLDVHWQRLHGPALLGFLAHGVNDVGQLDWLTIGTACAAQVTHAQALIDRLRTTYAHIVVCGGAQPQGLAGLWWRVADRLCTIAPATRPGLNGVQRLRGWYADAVIPRARWSDLLLQWDPLGDVPATMLGDCADGIPYWCHATHEDRTALLHRYWHELQAAELPVLPVAAVERIWPELAASQMTISDVTVTDAVAVQLVDPAVVAQIHDAIPWDRLPADTDVAARAAWLDDQLAGCLSRHPEWSPANIAVSDWMLQLRHELLGLGPLEAVLADPAVTEVMVNGPDTVWVERHGRIAPTSARFHSVEHLRHIVDRIVLPSGRRVDESVPIVDTRLPDGSRVNVVMPPVALHGPILTIRRFRREGWSLDDLIEAGAMPATLAAQLRALVQRRRSLLVIGGTGSGKTTLLNALAGAMSPHERIITIEDAAELQLPQPHVVRLEARPANIEGHGAIPIRDLVRTALRMRPDRIIVGECRGAEALDMLQAMNTGHEGSMTTLHANAPQEALHRLATLVCFAGLDLPLRAIHQQIGSAIHTIVAVGRSASGARGVRQVADVVTSADGELGLREWYCAPDVAAAREGA